MEIAWRLATAAQRGVLAGSSHCPGNYDYLLHVEVADLPAYEDFHANRLATLPSVASVTSYVTMKTLSPVQTGASGPPRAARRRLRIGAWAKG